MYPSEPPVIAFGTGRPGPWMPVRRVVDNHIEESQRLILHAGEQVQPGQAIVLGAGHCQEIPLAKLVNRFERVILNDMHPGPVEQALLQADLTTEQKRKVDVQIGDLTALTVPFLQRLESMIGETSAAALAVQRATELADSITPGSFSSVRRYELVIASCVLSQLHVVACNQALALFDARFPSEGELLRQSERWQQAFWGLARKMEDRFVTNLLQLLAPSGRIYLSDTVQVCFVHGTNKGNWLTQGSYRMTRTTKLLDYLDERFQVERQVQWFWVVDPPQAAGQVGRVFVVQACVLAAA